MEAREDTVHNPTMIPMLTQPMTEGRVKASDPYVKSTYMRVAVDDSEDESTEDENMNDDDSGDSDDDDSSDGSGVMETDEV